MKKILFAALPLTMLIACQESIPEKDMSIVPEKKATVDSLAQPVISTDANAMPVNVAQPSAAPATAGLNPAHGQPGHRCDIAVGAPLSSAPAAAPTVTPQQVAAPAATAPATVPSNSTAKLNPPHGEPGHNCAIPVGQPLN